MDGPYNRIRRECQGPRRCPSHRVVNPRLRIAVVHAIVLGYVLSRYSRTVYEYMGCANDHPLIQAERLFRALWVSSRFSFFQPILIFLRSLTFDAEVHLWIWRR